MKHNTFTGSSDQGMGIAGCYSAYHKQILNITTPGLSNLENVTNIHNLNITYF